MRIIIQCAATKSPGAGHLRTREGSKVKFVADPLNAPAGDDCLYSTPDDESDVSGHTWRDLLVECNDKRSTNESGLLEAYRLYEHPIYRTIVDDERIGLDKAFILSAGWGLVAADYRLPVYDITFSKNADVYKRRKPDQEFADFCQLTGAEANGDAIVCFVGKEYLSLLESLIGDIPSDKFVFFTTKEEPRFTSRGWYPVRYYKRHTNWHYPCAKAFLDGNISLK